MLRDAEDGFRAALPSCMACKATFQGGEGQVAGGLRFCFGTAGDVRCCLSTRWSFRSGRLSKGRVHFSLEHLHFHSDSGRGTNFQPCCMENLEAV